MQPAPFFYEVANNDIIPTIPEHLSQEAQDFILQCLKRDPVARPTVADLLQHKWLAADASSLATTIPTSFTPEGPSLLAVSSRNLRVSNSGREGRKGVYELSVSASLSQALAYARIHIETFPDDVLINIFRYVV